MKKMILATLALTALTANAKAEVFKCIGIDNKAVLEIDFSDAPGSKELGMSNGLLYSLSYDGGEVVGLTARKGSTIIASTARSKTITLSQLDGGKISSVTCDSSN